ncbi:uncharacterized protein LOC131860044 [Cryptomeria japonica]|uniref:uncharacterized protein LOC131860044 n=1 Tax=Cryptomeria japonica TaxID=3369 RepID=UPI0027D9F22F|nr:uncharacterized protein LOC131860044 [Cryptomeria japonica]
MENTIGGSPIWRFIWKSRKIIKEHLTWKIGNGKKAKFWRDSWCGEETLVDMMEDQDWVNQVEAEVGMFVADYIRQFDSQKEPIIWKMVGLWNRGNSLKLAKILKGRKVHILNEEDTLIWNAEKSSDYKVNLGYELQRRRQKDSNWPVILCWDKRVLPKAGAFLWIALHGRILTSDRLKAIGISGPSRCYLCKEEEEIVDHLLYG